MNLDNEKRYTQIFDELLESENISISIKNRYLFLKKILERLSIEVTEDSALQFPSLFSRLVYITQKFQLPDSLSWQLQNIRIKSNFLNKNDLNTISEAEYIQAKRSIEIFLTYIFEKNRINLDNFEKEIVPIKNEKEYIRVQVTNINREEYILTAIESLQNNTIYIKYNVPHINDMFNTTIDKIWVNSQLNIIDYKIDNLGFYIPNIFVLEPDYLIDASALSECFQYYGHSHLHYFRRRFETISNSKHILLGNLSNSFLDELVFSENIQDETFENKFIQAFKQNPFEFTSCRDIKDKSSFIDFMNKAKSQFENIRRTITHDFMKNDMNTENCILEPSFYCEKYGFQGRLDLLHIKDNYLKIIELKSSSLPYPKNDPTKISINHEVQTAIYRLIISTVFKNKYVDAAILYSACDNQNENIRYAASYKTLNKEIINTRNLIVSTEHDIYVGNHTNTENLLEDICNINNYGAVPSFFIEQINKLSKNIHTLSKIEKTYLCRFITFISRDLYIHKVGGAGYESHSSIADLWNTNFADRLESFNIINNLEISEIDDFGKDLKITFDRIYSTDFVNFREGELCILYPKDNNEDTVLTNQILKGYIEKISDKNIVLRFRYKQKNKKYFEIHQSWIVEHDYLDHGYNYMYKSIFKFFQSPKEIREIILGIKKPCNSNSTEKYLVKKQLIINNSIEDRKEKILEKAITSSNYFLLVGPPGTGKTSQYARELIEYYFYNTTNNILVIAYTNKAVDELCETICSSFNTDYESCNNYIRIGTEISCNEKYRHRLLQNIADGVKSRDELNNIITKQRIFVGTLASISGKQELFNIKKFNISIIDEASQILEPQIIGLLPLVEKFIMIGDHKQLSTITLQDNSKSNVDDELLNTIKLTNCKESLFERLYRLCKENCWTENYDTLIYQGRMHTDIQNFPNKYFYSNILKPINPWQSVDLEYKNELYTNVYSDFVARKRVGFIDTADTFSSMLTDKVNYKEAEIAIDLCKAIIDNYELNNIEFNPDQSLGIITPFRNQIALIKHKVSTVNEKYRLLLSNVMIDTVERFQGSQRDIIIISFCMNKPYQLDLFCNWDRDKIVDRKLNVAITRARKQMFLIGNKNILENVNIYKKLIETISQ